MAQHSDLNTLLQLIRQPAFLVEDGQITRVNSAAAACLVQAGQAFEPMLATGQAEYAEFTGGSLYVTLSLCGIRRDACVQRIQEVDVVTVEEAGTQEKLQVLAMAARALRDPISGIVTASESFFPAAVEAKEALEPQAAQMNRRLYQLLRIMGNMSDAADWAAGGRMETIEICGFVEEILQKAAEYNQHFQAKLSYALPKQPIFTLANADHLERAVLNQLSNALKFAVCGTEVTFRLVKKGQRIYLSVINVPRDPEARNKMHNRFLRAPGLEDSRHGLGLGMLLMQNAASAHEGAVLVDQVGDALRVTLSLPIRQSGSQVRSHILGFDYAGERDHCLVELSDVLPAEAYTTEQLK